jgi:translation initiation factor IF-2
MMKLLEVAHDVGVSAEELIEILQDIEIAVDGPDAELNPEQIAQVCDELGYASIEAARTENVGDEGPETAPPAEEPTIEGEEGTSPVLEKDPALPEEEAAESNVIELKKPKVIVKDFAQMMDMKPNQVIAELMRMNIFASINAEIDLKIAKEIGAKHGFTVR